MSQLVAAGCVLAGVILLVVFRNRNDLSGCGDRHVMESVGLIKSEVDPSLRTSTIFGDLPPFEETADSKDEEKSEEQEKPDGAKKKHKKNKSKNKGGKTNASLSSFNIRSGTRINRTITNF